MFSRRQRLVVLFDRQHQFKHPVKMYAVEVDVVTHCVKVPFFVQKLQILEKLGKSIGIYVQGVPTSFR